MPALNLSGSIHDLNDVRILVNRYAHSDAKPPPRFFGPAFAVQTLIRAAKTSSNCRFATAGTLSASFLKFVGKFYKNIDRKNKMVYYKI
jgi:hypothetical protein